MHTLCGEKWTRDVVNFHQPTFHTYTFHLGTVHFCRVNPKLMYLNFVFFHFVDELRQ